MFLSAFVGVTLTVAENWTISMNKRIWSLAVTVWHCMCFSRLTSCQSNSKSFSNQYSIASKQLLSKISILLHQNSYCSIRFPICSLKKRLHTQSYLDLSFHVDFTWSDQNCGGNILQYCLIISSWNKFGQAHIRDAFCSGPLACYFERFNFCWRNRKTLSQVCQTKGCFEEVQVVLDYRVPQNLLQVTSGAKFQAYCLRTEKLD